MPLSHDSKPSMRHRRQKYQIETQGKKPKRISARAAQRRYLRQLTRQKYQAQHELEVALRKMGIPWRALEVMVNKELKGSWKKIDNALLDRLFDKFGVREKVKEAA